MKPKWYVLGTEGAIVGQWRHERVIGRNNVGNLVEDPLAASESPAVLSLHAPDGSRHRGAVGAATGRSRSTASSPTGCYRCADVGDARGLAAQHRGHGGRHDLGARGRPAGHATVTVRWGFLGAGFIAGTALAPAVHAADGARAAGGRRPRRRPGPRT